MKQKLYHKDKKNQKNATPAIQLFNTVGIIIKATYLHAAIPTDKAINTNVIKIDTYTNSLQKMAQDFLQLGIENIAISIAGPYWMQVFNILQEKGFKVSVVNPEQIRLKPFKHFLHGEPCQRLQQLHSYGLTKASFVPDKIILSLREYMAERNDAENDKIKSLQKIGAALLKMNIKLPHAFSDMEGVVAMQTIKAIAKGQTDPEILADIKNHIENTHGIKIPQQDLIEALTGYHAKEHLFVINKNLEKYEQCKKIMQDCDREMHALLWRYVSGDPDQVIEEEKLNVRKNQISFSVAAPLKQLTGVDLSLIDGLSDHTMLSIICCIGWDMSRWGSAAELTSWLALTPDEDNPHKTPCQATQAFRLAAQSLHNSKCYTGMLYRYFKKTLGSASKAIKAIARQLAIDFYTLLTQGEEKFQRKKLFLQKQLEKKIEVLEKRSQDKGSI